MENLAKINFSLFGLLPELVGVKKKKEPMSNSFGFSAKLNGVSNYELPYVYHHLHVGRRLSLKVNGDNVSVYYRAHKLGDLPFISSKRMLRLLESGYNVQVKIKSMNKSVYLPIEELQIAMNFQLNS